MKYLIYAVEDDESIRELYTYTFKNVDYDIETFENAESMLDTLDTRIPNVILMDVMLPGIDGITAVERIRANESYDEVSIIVISAKGDELNKVKGLDAGADDYLAKPFGVLELVARVKANIRRSKSAKADKNVISYDEVTVNVDEHTASVRGKNLALTLKEFNLLKLLVENVGKVVTRETILADVWGYEYFGETRTLDMHIKSLRGKIAELSDVQYIHTVRGVGYKFNKE